MANRIFTNKNGQLRMRFAVPLAIILSPLIVVGVVTYPLWGCMNGKLNSNE